MKESKLTKKVAMEIAKAISNGIKQNGWRTFIHQAKTSPSCYLSSVKNGRLVMTRISDHEQWHLPEQDRTFTVQNFNQAQKRVEWFLNACKSSKEDNRAAHSQQSPWDIPEGYEPSENDWARACDCLAATY